MPVFRRVLCLRELYLRAFSSTPFATAKTGYFLQKLIAKSKARTSNPYTYVLHDSVVPSATRKPQEITQRQKVLNAVFMENISNVMFIGPIGERLQGYGIELTEVRVSVDCTHLNVYWITSLTAPGIEEKISKLLTSCSGLLRTELISCQLMGRVPRITFVYDASYRRAHDVEKLISRISLEIPKEEQECSELASDSSAETENKCVEDQKSDSDLSHQKPAPHVPCDMTMNIFGLDHAAVMREVTAKMKRTRGILRNAKSDIESASSSSGRTNSDAQKSMIKEFVQLQKQQATMSKKMEQEAEKSLHRLHECDDSERAQEARFDSLQAEHSVEPEDEYDEEEVARSSYLDGQSHIK